MAARPGLTDWTNLSRVYRRDRDDLVELCRKCHKAHDADAGDPATEIFGRKKVQNE